ncbi:alpha/beta fold hydrolase [Actinomadura madurae]|nr:alpha/beta fold hydrolase [Actinomadura madurae]MCP9978267.1 alpha/beta fold hydrolase [Actinomadura madurae]
MTATSQDAVRTGAGPGLVLLHGGGPGVDAASNWASVRSRISSEFRCLAPDLLGFGTQITGAGARGLRGPGTWARARSRQILDLLDRHGLERAHLVGNSAAGGAAALALMAAAPGRIGRAVVMGGAGTGPLPRAVPFYDEPTRESMRATLGRLVAEEGPHRALLDELTDLRLEQALRPGAEAAFRSMFAAGGPPPSIRPASSTRSSSCTENATGSRRSRFPSGSPALCPTAA